MKRFFYNIILLMATVLVAGCQGDETEPATPAPDNYLELRIAANSTTATRSRTTNWLDTNAEDEEMMNLWVVVITNTSDGSVYKCFACRPSAGSEREIDDVGRIVKGEYTVYSFANISVANVCSLLGLTQVSDLSTITSTPVEFTVTGKVTDAANKTATINGNGFVPTATNNYGETGIPMSNVQTIAAADSRKDLIVVRMMAKIVLQLYNETGSPVTVEQVTLSDLTANAANNLKLLPSLNYPDDMTAADHHKDIQPNLNGTPTTTDYVYTVPEAQQTVSTAQYDNGSETPAAPAQTLTLYVNESRTPANGNQLFYLTLKMSNTEYRYAIINDEDNHGWNYIARNDRRIIPIIIDDYKLELIPYDFPPIGVYPASVREIEGDLYEMTFHDYGHFHLVPKVTKTSNNSTIGYSSSTPTNTTTAWTLNTDWAGSWKTAATKGGAWLDAAGVVANGFYRNQTDEADADEAGGVPVWYANDGTAGPQWDPSASANYVPFIFGYIAEPATLPLTVDRKIYHEFRVKLYVDGEYRRDLLYRFYMTLSKDQMLGARSAAPLPSEGRGRGGVVRRPHNSPHE